MQGVRIAGQYGCVFIERNKYAPWGRCARQITSRKPAPFVWRRGNGKLDEEKR